MPFELPNSWPRAQQGIVVQRTGREVGLESFWLKHGRFTQNVSFARDLCVAAEVVAKKGPKERSPSTESYLMPAAECVITHFGF